MVELEGGGRSHLSRMPSARGFWQPVQQLDELALVDRDCSAPWFRASTSLSLYPP